MPNGSPPDDPDISDDETIYRRVTADQVKWKSGSAIRAGSNAFLDSSSGSPCSIVLESKLVAHGLGPKDVLRGYEDRCGLAQFSAEVARACGFGVLYTPNPPSEPAHGSLTGDKTDLKPRKDLARRTHILIEPPSTR